METYEIHFEERWDETIELTQLECKDWLDEIVEIAYNPELTYGERLQKIVNCVQ